MESEHTSTFSQNVAAIAQLWPMLLIVFFIIVFISYRKRIPLIFSKISKVSSKTQLGEYTVELLKESASENQSITSRDRHTDSTKNEIIPEIVETKEASFLTIFEAFYSGNFEEANNLFEELQNKTPDIENKELNRILYIEYTIYYQQINSIQELENIVSNTQYQSTKYHGYKVIAYYYSKNKQFDEAIKFLSLAQQYTKNEKEKTTIAISISDAIKYSNTEEAINFILKFSKDIKECTELSRLYITIAKLYQDNEQFQEECFARELALKYDPSNDSNIFSLAYDYNEERLGLSSLSYLHYKNIQFNKFHRQSATNNLGVIFQSWGLKGQAVKMYKLALELESNISAANLANKYMNEGFYEEAQELLNKAKLQNDATENVFSSLQILNSNIKSEEEKENLYSEQASKHLVYMQRYSEAFFESKDTLVSLKNTTWSNEAFTFKVEEGPGSGFINFSIPLDSFNYSFILPQNHQKTFYRKDFDKVSNYGISQNRLAYGYLDREEKMLYIFIYGSKTNEGFLLAFSKVE